MILLLRQSNVTIGTDSDHQLTLKDACFLRINNAEVFDDGVQFLPTSTSQVGVFYFVEKTAKGDWREPNTGIVYDFLKIYPDDGDDMLHHLLTQCA